MNLLKFSPSVISQFLLYLSLFKQNSLILLTDNYNASPMKLVIYQDKKHTFLIWWPFLSLRCKIPTRWSTHLYQNLPFWSFLAVRPNQCFSPIIWRFFSSLPKIWNHSFIHQTAWILSSCLIYCLWKYHPMITTLGYSRTIKIQVFNSKLPQRCHLCHFRIWCCQYFFILCIGPETLANL